MREHLPESGFSFVHSFHEAVVGDRFTHVPPSAFDRIQIRAVGRQIDQFQLRMCLQPLLQPTGMVERDVIDYHYDTGMGAIDIQQPFEVATEAFPIAPVVKGDGNLTAHRVNRTHTGQPLAAGLLAENLRLRSPEAPPIAHCGGIGQRKLILKQQYRIGRGIQEFFFNCRTNALRRAGSASAGWPLAFCQLNPSCFKML